MNTDSRPHSRTPLEIDPRSFDRSLLLGFTAVAALGLIIESLAASLADDSLFGLFPIISLRYEQNLPAWYLMGLYLLAGFLACLIAAADRREQPAKLLWISLAATLVWLSLDEFAGLEAMLSRALESALQPDLIESAVQDYGTALIAAGTTIAVLLALSIRIGYRIAVLWIALPAMCQVRLTMGFVAITIAPLVKDWSLPFRLWYDFGGPERSEHLVYLGLDWLRSSMEIAGASLVCSALVSFLAGDGRSLIIALEAPRRTLGQEAGFSLQATGEPTRNDP